MDANLRLEKKIINISFAGSFTFLIAEAIAAYYMRSNAILMDCVFDIADLIMIGPFMVLIPLLYKPVTEKRPYGFSQVESLFVIIKCAILVVVTVLLIVDSTETILDGGNHVDAGAVAAFELGLSLACLIMYIVLKKINKKFSSPSIKAELYIWKLDAYSTLGVGLAFLVSIALQKTSLAFIAPYVDPGIAIILAVILIKEPISMVIESQKNMMLFAPGEEINETIRKTAESCLNKYGYYINFLDVIKTGRKYWADIYIVLDSDEIRISELKKADKELNEALSSELDDIFVQIIPDVDKIREENLEKMKAARRQEIITYVENREHKRS